MYGEAGPKAAQDCGGEPVDPKRARSSATRRPSPGSASSWPRTCPARSGRHLTKTCLYTLTPDRDFVVDRLPDVPGVAVGSGAAHGFKFASVLGRVLAELSGKGGPCPPRRSPFRIECPILLEADPATSWMV